MALGEGEGREVVGEVDHPWEEEVVRELKRQEEVLEDLEEEVEEEPGRRQREEEMVLT